MTCVWPHPEQLSAWIHPEYVEAYAQGRLKQDYCQTFPFPHTSLPHFFLQDVFENIHDCDFLVGLFLVSVHLLSLLTIIPYSNDQTQPLGAR